MQNTKIIIVLMLILFGLSSALRIGSRQEGDTGVGNPVQTATPPTDENADTSATETQEEDNFFSSVESRTFYETHVSSLRQTIVNNNEEYFQATISRTSEDGSEESERNDLQGAPTNIADKVWEEYRRARGRFDFTSAHVYVFRESFWIILATENGDVTVDRSDLRSFLGSDRKYDNVLDDLFNHRGSSFSVADATFIYYLNQHRDNVQSREYNVAISTSNGNYQVKALPFELRSILIKRPQNMDLHGEWYSFQFALDLDNTNFLTARTEGMSGLVPIS